MTTAGVGGALATGIDMATLLVLTKLAMPVAIAAFLASSIGALVAFSFNKYVAFRDRSPLAFEQVARFGFVALTTALAMAGSMKLLVEHGHLAVWLAKLECAAVVFVAWTYPAQRRLVFRRPSAVVA
jgi:putative flippase GtrA